MHKPRGQQKALVGGTLPEIISPYMLKLIEQTGGEDGPVGRQFIARNSSKDVQTKHIDPLIEEENEVAPGVIYKYRGKLDENGTVIYHGRVLWTISRFCATYCRFCFRGRMVGLPASQSKINGETILQKPYLNKDDIEKVITYIKTNKEINEVILSGGDPLIAPQNYLTGIFEKLAMLQKEGDLDFIRVHTRAPITNPVSIQPWHFDLLNTVKDPHIVLHINHPAELTAEVLENIEKLKKAGALLFSQSVLLKGVNDSVEVLYSLFTSLAKIGVRPYYLHYNDPVYWAQSFTVPFPKAIKIWRELRKRLSGIAGTAKFVIDTPYGYGKVPIPEGEWEDDFTAFIDFKGEKHKLL